jgi:hypothetical protein
MLQLVVVVLLMRLSNSALSFSFFLCRSHHFHVDTTVPENVRELSTAMHGRVPAE